MKSTKIYQTFIFIIITFAVYSLISCEQEEQEWQVTANEVPHAVRDAFAKAYPDAEIKGYSAEKEDGQQYYEVSCIFDGRKIDVLYHSDGNIAETEEVIAKDEIPEAVIQSLTGEIKDHSINLAEKSQKDGQLSYELKVADNTDGKKYELLFSETGKLLEKSEMDKNDDDDD